MSEQRDDKVELGPIAVFCPFCKCCPCLTSCVRSAVARSDLADELERLGRKATQGPWSNNILQDFRGHSGSNDTPYVYGPESHPKLLMGLWPVHPPEETAAVEQRMFDTLDLICSLRNHLPEIIAALRTQSAIGRSDTERMDWLERMTVNVRRPALYGSWNEFWANPGDERNNEEEGAPSDIRKKIDEAMRATDSGSSK